MKNRLLLLGPPASGKGTQADFIQKRFGIPTTSTGAILRAEAKSGTSLGLWAPKIIRAGGLAPDDVIMQMVQTWLTRIDGSFLLDGFPRTVVQAECFDQLVNARGQLLDLVIFLELPEQTIYSRMALRLTCTQCGKAVSPADMLRIQVGRARIAAAGWKSGRMTTRPRLRAAWRNVGIKRFL